MLGFAVFQAARSLVPYTTSVQRQTVPMQTGHAYLGRHKVGHVLGEIARAHAAVRFGGVAVGPGRLVRS